MGIGTSIVSKKLHNKNVENKAILGLDLSLFDKIGKGELCNQCNNSVKNCVFYEHILSAHKNQFVRLFATEGKRYEDMYNADGKACK